MHHYTFFMAYNVVVIFMIQYWKHCHIKKNTYDATYDDKLMICRYLIIRERHTVSSVQSLSRVWLFATPWITARQASLSIINSRSAHRLAFIESVMPSNHPILCHPLLLLPSIFPSIRVFSNEPTLLMTCPKYWSFSFSIIPSKEIPGLISFRTAAWYSLEAN